MAYKVTEENNISTVFLSGEIDMDVTDKAKEVIIPLTIPMAIPICVLPQEVKSSVKCTKTKPLISFNPESRILKLN